MSDEAQNAPQSDEHDYRSLDFSEFDAANLVTLCRLRVNEADMAKAKLQAEGIPVLIRDMRTAVTNPLILSDVPLLVRESDLERAMEILARPADDSAPGEYVDEDYRCPRCHRRDVELLPLSRGWRRVRTLCLILAVLPIGWTLFRTLAAYSPSETVSTGLGYAMIPWFFVLVVGGSGVLLARRDKRCKSCGFEWSKGKNSSPSHPAA
jgi:hypothetical protein